MTGSGYRCPECNGHAIVTGPDWRCTECGANSYEGGR